MDKNKKKFIILGCCLVIVIAIILVFAFIYSNKSKTNNENENINEKNSDKENKLVFPYTDEDGRVRYKLVINGIEVKTENYPFKLNEEDKGSYYPLKDVLNYFNIESLSSNDNTILTSKINGNIIRVDADQGKMKYGKTTLEALDGNIKTIIINNVLYVPSFFFMSLTDNSIVDYSKDGSSATLTTDLVVNLSNSGPSGLSLVETNSNGSSVASNGYHICSSCGGAGGSNVAYFDQPLVNGRYIQVKKYRWESCPVCGGSGHVH